MIYAILIIDDISSRILKRKVVMQYHATLRNFCVPHEQLQYQLLCDTQGFTHFLGVSIKGITLFVDNLKEGNRLKKKSTMNLNCY
jgi:hypothetical protein